MVASSIVLAKSRRPQLCYAEGVQQNAQKLPNTRNEPIKRTPKGLVRLFRCFRSFRAFLIVGGGADIAASEISSLSEKIGMIRWFPDDPHPAFD